jgi:DNA-binding transcriptional ArsR family regulator
MSKSPEQPAVLEIRDTERLQALCHPTRVAMLEALREPASAASVARELGQPRQRVGHHLKTLEQAGLVVPVASRRNGNFVETLYRSAARTFIVAPEVAWADPRRVEALASQHSIQNLVQIGERLQRDALVLLDRAAFDGERVPSAAVSAEASFASEEEREEFLKEYLKTTRELLERFGSRHGDPYRIVLAVHPRTEGSMQ